MQINLDDVEYLTETSITIRGTRRRTTVPKEIAEYFGLRDGDRIRWILFKDKRLMLFPKESGNDHNNP
jgi:bifunctional DNA-binding transcriptional regulator/antitoxin component of YhaV-PrlF toxin-antitoxin module